MADAHELMGEELARIFDEWWKLPPKLTISESVARAWGECVWTARILFHGEIASVELERYDRERG